MSKRQTKSTTESSAKTSSGSRKTATKRETVASLRDHVDSIVSRLKTADTNTRKSVKALETAISALEKQIKSHQKVDHAELSERVDQLATHLTKSIDNTKRDIASDLRSALENPTVSGVEAAIERSEQRLADTEMAQARALSKVNKHLADLARVIDARFRNQEGETKENAAKITELSEQVTQSYDRIALIENSAAEAIRKVGDEVVGTAETFQSKLESQNASLRERIESIAARTKEDFDQQKTDLSRRMESIEDSQKNQSNYIDRSISKLAARIDSLEFGLTQPSEVVVAPPPMIPPASPEAAFAQAPDSQDPAFQNPVAPVQDAFAPVLEADEADDSFVFQDAPVATPEPMTPQPAVFDPQPAYDSQPQAYAPAATTTPPPLPPAQFTDAGSEVSPPQEYQPQPPQATMAPQHQYVDPAQAAQTAQHTTYQSAAYAHASQPAANPYMDTAPEAAEYTPPVAFNPSIVDDELPYENPGYSEGGSEEGLSRPGHVTGIREKSKRKKSGKKLLDSSALSNLPITPRNLKVAGLALAVATIGYLGLRGLTGGGSETPQQNPVANAPAGQPINTAGTMPVMPAGTPGSQISVSEPIGTYQDNTTPPPETVAFKGNQTLTEAADSGNATAQFQLGISYLDAGQTKKGLEYVRKAANQNQPAAQYRLAKLYEAGIGVTADPDLARELTERAARAGNRIAMHDLGLYYAEGRGGVERNLTTAMSWFEKAGERGVVDSQYNLGILMGSTPEIPTDIVSSYFWFSVAAAQGDQFAGNQLETLKGQLSPEQLKQAEARLAEFKPVAIDEAANGIFREVPWSMPSMQNFSPTSDLVRDAQSLLGQLGYDVGVADGDIGPKTRTAVKAFERANGLPETGAVTGSLVDRLEAAAGV